VTLQISRPAHALAVIHDDNRDGELATNWMGKPTRDTDFRTTKGTLGAPSFEAASFSYKWRTLKHDDRLTVLMGTSVPSLVQSKEGAPAIEC
jgi:uncharacterized protein (DUF2141 family)